MAPGLAPITRRAGEPRPEPAGTALYRAIADPDSLAIFGDEIEAGDPSEWPGYPEAVRRARRVAGSRHAVTTAVATIGGEPCVIAGFEFAFLGGSMGVAEGSAIARAFDTAIAQRLPIVCVTASGGARMQEGTSALVQMQVIAGAIAAARHAGIPHIAVVGDPTTGGVWSSLAACADVIIGIEGARVSFSGTRTRPDGAAAGAAQYRAAGQCEGGFLDAIGTRADLRMLTATVVRLLSPRTRGGTEPAELPAIPAPAGPRSDTAAAAGAAAATDAWSRVTRARGQRSRADQWLAGHFDQIFEIRGDRCGGVDEGMRCGFGGRGGRTIAFAAQTGSRVRPAGFRTATRLLRLAARLGRPVLTLIDTPGAAADPADEAAGVGAAIAELLVAVASSPVPVTSVVIGEGVSGGAIALAAPGNLWMAPDAYLSVAAPENAASILRLPAAELPELTDRLRLTPAELISRGIVRGIAERARPSPDQAPRSR